MKHRQVLLAGEAIQRKLLFVYVQVGVEEDFVAGSYRGQQIGRDKDLDAQSAQADDDRVRSTRRNAPSTVAIMAAPCPDCGTYSLFPAR